MSTNPHLPQSPLNPLPPVVWALVVPMILLEVIFQLSGQGLIGGADGIGWRMQALERMVFIPEQFLWMVQTGQFPPRELARIVIYPFAHLSFMHAAFVVVFVLALGKFVGELFRPLALVGLFFGSSILAAIVYAALGQKVPLVGGYAGAFGLIGAFSFVLWVRLRQRGESGLQAFSLIGVMILVRLAFGIFGGVAPDWIADLAGFAAGFGLSFVLIPGGPKRLLTLLRAR